MSEENNNRKPLTEQERKMLRHKREMAYRRKLQQLRDAETPEEREVVYNQIHRVKREELQPTTLSAKWDNFRYHYGKVSLAILIGVGILGFLLFDMLTAEKYDVEITAVISDMGNVSYDSLSETLSPFMQDYDGDGDTDVYVDNLQLDRENLEEIDSNTVMAVTTRLSAATSSNDFLLYFVDEYYYNALTEADLEFVDLSQYSDAEGVEGDRYDLTVNPAFDGVETDELYLVICDIAYYTEKEQKDLQEQFDRELDFVLQIIGE